MPRMHIVWDCDWQPRKAEQVTLELRRFLIRERAINIGAVEPVDKSIPPAKYLVLECRGQLFGEPCGSTWESAIFTACPKCKQRRYVHKVETRTEEPLPPVTEDPAPIPVEDHPEEIAPPAA